MHCTTEIQMQSCSQQSQYHRKSNLFVLEYLQLSGDGCHVVRLLFRLLTNWLSDPRSTSLWERWRVCVIGREHISDGEPVIWGLWISGVDNDTARLADDQLRPLVRSSRLVCRMPVNSYRSQFGSLLSCLLLRVWRLSSARDWVSLLLILSLKPVLNWANVCSRT